MTINAESGKVFRIVAENSSKENKYIQSAKLNGKPWNKPWITHKDIVSGGELILKWAINRMKSVGKTG